MKKLLLVRYGEISLKGLNRNYFIDTLVSNIKYSVRNFSGIRVSKIQGRIIVDNYDEIDEPDIIDALRKVFGIVYITKACQVETDIEVLKDQAVKIMQGYIGKSFKVESRRANKAFPIESPEISKLIGAHILKNVQGLRVDVHEPEIILGIEIREKSYITYENIVGEAGLPLGTSGKGGILLSGGIDSPVASYLMSRRGMKMYGIHFHSYPFTSKNAQEKVVDISKFLAEYNKGFELTMFSVTKIQQEIIRNCNESYLTVILRRYMLRIAEAYAKQMDLKVLVTGESLGQVASQTAESIICTDACVDMPILRPCIGMDKNEIIKHSLHINTYEKSIEPYEDCCTVFVPKHPQTKPKLERVLEEESKIKNSDELILESLNNPEIIRL